MQVINISVAPDPSSKVAETISNLLSINSIGTAVFLSSLNSLGAFGSIGSA